MKKYLECLKYPFLFLLTNLLSFLIAFFLFYLSSNSLSFETINTNDLLLVSIVVNFFFFLYLRKKYVVKKTKMISPFYLIMLGISFGIFGNFIASFFIENITTGKISLLYFITSVIIGPILEEYIFRGLAFQSLKKFLTPSMQVLVSSIIFMLFHSSLNQMLFAFMLGLLLGYIYLKTHNIKNVIVIHIFVNLIGVYYYDIISYLNPLLIASLSIIILFTYVKSYRTW